MVRVSSIGHLEKVGKGLSIQHSGLEQAAERIGKGREDGCGAGFTALGPLGVGTVSTGIRDQEG